MAQQGAFDATLVPAGWFDDTAAAGGWFAPELLDAGPPPPADVRPQDADWDWDEVLFSDVIPTGYQQANVVSAQQFYDEWNWSETVDDDWQADDVQTAAPAAQPAQDEWDWDEFLPPDSIPTGFQQADVVVVVPPALLQDAWDFDEQVEDEWLVEDSQNVNAPIPRQEGDADWDWDEVLFSDSTPTGFQQADVVVAPTATQPVQDDWNYDGDFGGEDGWSNHYTAYDPAIPRQEGDAEWDWDEFVYGDVIPTGYQQADVAPVQPSQSQDWFYDWDESVDDEWFAEDVQQNPPSAVQQFGFEWDFDEVLFSDVVPTGYQSADFVAPLNPEQQAQVDWDFDSDFGGEDGWSNHYTAYDRVDPIQQFGFEWDWDECVFGESFPTGYQNADAAAVVVPPVETPSNLPGFDMRVRKYYVRRNGRIYLFNTAEEADQWIAADKAAEDAVKASKKTSRLARKRLRERVFKVNAAPIPEVVDQTDLELAIAKVNLPFDALQLIKLADLEQILMIQELARRMQDDEDIELLLLTM